MFESAGALLINGTHLSQPGVFAASTTAARWVKAAGGRVIFDVDYRPVLWGLAGKDMGERRFVAHATVSQKLQEVLPTRLIAELGSVSTPDYAISRWPCVAPAA